MSTSYSPLNNAATNLKALLEEQNADGVYAAKLNGWEPFEVLAAKTIYNAYADVQAAIAADVEGPATSTDNALVRFDGTTGKLIQNSNAILTDAGALSISSNLTVSGGATVSGSVSGYNNGEIIIGGTGSGGFSALSTRSTGSPTMVFDHRGASNTGYWSWRNGTNAGTTAMSLSASGNLTVSGSASVASSNTAGYGFSTITHTPPYIRQHAVETLDIVGGYNGTRILTNGGASTVVSIDSAGLATFGSSLTVSGTEPTASLSSTAASSIAYQLISGGNLGHTLGTFKIYDSTTGYTVFSHAKPTSGPSVRMSFDAAGAATLGGNLTVSGTGGSTFNAASVSTPSSAYQANQAFRIISTTTAEVQQAFLSSGNFGYYIQVGGSLAYPLMLQPSGSNVLIGTTTDSSNGKLQLPNGTTSASGVGFGIDTSLYRSGGGALVLSAVSNPSFTIAGTGNGVTVTLKLGDGVNNDQGFISSNGGNLVFGRNSTTALTLDSSQRCILAGALRLNNAYTAGAPTATGYVTIQDSSGTTYKVLVGT